MIWQEAATAMSRTSQQTDTTTPVTSRPRSVAIAELFDVLEGLLLAYRVLPDADRDDLGSTAANQITAEVGLHLNIARNRVARQCT